MTQIRIDTEHARQVGRRLIAESDHLTEIGHDLQRAIGSLDTWAWDGRSRSRAEPMLSRVRPEGARVANGLNDFGQKLVRVADVFEQVDRETVGDIVPPDYVPSDWLPGVQQPRDWRTTIGIAVGVVDSIMLSLLNRLMPGDLPFAEEYFTIKSEGEFVIPLAELGLPFSGYLSGENGITIKRNEDGTYSVIIGRAGGVGADFSQDNIVGAQVGLRGEQGYEFAFDPNSTGDLSRMALLITTLAGSTVLVGLGGFGMQIGQIAESATISSLKDNMTSISGGVGLEGEAGLELGPTGEIDIEGTCMVGMEMRRDDLDDQSWDAVVSYKMTGEIEGQLPALDVLKAKGELGYELTFNGIVDTQTGQTTTEVVLEIQTSAGGQLSLDDIEGVLPPGVDVDVSIVEGTGKLEITYHLDSPVENTINTVQEGSFDAIVENSSIEISSSSGTTTTVGGELKKSIAPGQTIGGEAEGKISSGYEIKVI